jgi:hypothetical protein
MVIDCDHEPEVSNCDLKISGSSFVNALDELREGNEAGWL